MGRKQGEKKGTEKNYENNQKTMNKMAISTNLSIITLKINELNASIKKQGD